MHAVDEVHIGMAGRSPENVITCSATGSRVCGSIAGAEISFHFHDSTRYELSTFFADNQFAKKLARDGAGIAVKEFPRKKFRVGWRFQRRTEHNVFIPEC
jgi:hypothetical protein